MRPGAALLAALLGALLAGPRGETRRLLSGQPYCWRGTQGPCYKVFYFSDASQRLNFEEARAACGRDGGQLVSIESDDEQKLIKKFIEKLPASDGDFWIGLRRHEEKQSNSIACQDLYTWVDGSLSTFRNWYKDEPSCGSEFCVVMYHQPSAPTGTGGPYKFQWNDDQCRVKNNYICKYSHEAAWNLAYILAPSIPLALLLLVATVLCCIWIWRMRKREQLGPGTKEQYRVWPPPHPGDSPDLEVYSVIRKQSQADLAEPRPDLKNISFRGCSGDATPDDVSRACDDMAVNPSESGFVTLASMESGFVTNDIYELSPDRGVRSKECGWVENEIYGY